LSAVGVFAIGLISWTVLPAPAAAASTTGRRVTFGIAPASAHGPNGRAYLSYGVTGGARLRDFVVVLNYSTVPLNLQVYPTDAIETSEGGFGLSPVTAKPTDVGSWISLPRRSSTVRVPARSARGAGQVVIPLLVRIPDKAPPGDHVGGVVASLRTVGTNASGQNIILLQRVAVRVFIRVAGRLSPKLVLADLHTIYQGSLNPVGQGQLTVSYVVTNAGNVDLALGHQSLLVSGLFGSKRQVPLSDVGLLIPGSSLRESAVVPGVWPQVIVHTTASVRVLSPTGGDVPGLVSVSSSTWIWAIPWTLLALLVLVALALVVAYRVRRVAQHRAVPQAVSA